jgi:ABC-2 type transport system permease protein
LNAIRAIVARDFRRLRRAPLTVALLMAFPVAIAALIALAFGSGGAPPMDILVSSVDDSFVLDLLDNVGGSPAVPTKIARVDSTEGRALLQKGRGNAMLHFPAGFFDDVLDGRETTLEVWKNSRQGILPQVVEEGAYILADGLTVASDLFGEPIREIRTFRDGAATQDRLDATSLAMGGVFQRASPYLFPPAIGIANEATDESSGGPPTPGRLFLFVLPGLVVMALLMITDQSMRDWIRESTSGTLALSLTAPTRIEALVLGKIGFTVLLGLSVLTVFTLLGAPLLGDPIALDAFAALSLAFCFAAGGFSSIVYGVAKTERQGGTIGSVVMLVMAFLGGSYVPLSALPDNIRALSPFTVNFWAVDGYTKILQDGAGLFDVASNLGVLAVLGAVFGVGGSVLLRRRVMGGLR